MIRKILSTSAACVFLIACGSGSSSSDDIASNTVVPTELIGTWNLACFGDAESGYEENTHTFTDANLEFTLTRFVDDTCQTVNTEDPGHSSSGAVTFGDVITTTNGVEAREFNHLNDTFNSMPLDSVIESFNIYLIQDGVLFIAGGGLTEEERPDTLDFELGSIKQ